jgi:hypothetical protein
MRDSFLALLEAIVAGLWTAVALNAANPGGRLVLEKGGATKDVRLLPTATDRSSR